MSRRMPRPILVLAILLLSACTRPSPPPPASEPAPIAQPRPVDEAKRAEAEKLREEGLELLRTKRFPPAVLKLERSVALDPSNSDGHTALAEAYWKSERWDDALREVERGRDLDPTNFRAHYGIAVYSSALERHAEAEAAYRRVLELRPGYPDALRGLGSTGLTVADFPLCVEAFQSLIAALEAREPARLSDEDKTLYQTAREQISYCQEGLRGGLPARRPRPAPDGDPKAAARRTQSRKLLQSANSLLEARRPAAAALKLEQARALDPDFGPITIQLARAYWESGRREEAVPLAERGRELDPFERFGYATLGFYYRTLGRYAESEASYRKMLELAPADSWAMGSLSVLGLESGNFPLCIEGGERLLREMGRRPPALLSDQTKADVEQAVARLARCRAKKR
jgi:tetratricopeptide (TPR) repeat protein